MGPLVTRAHLDKVRAYVDLGVAEGAAHQRGRAISHIAGNEVAVQFGTTDVSQHRIDGMNQIKA